MFVASHSLKLTARGKPFAEVKRVSCTNFLKTMKV